MDTSERDETTRRPFFANGLDVHVESSVLENATTAVRWCIKGDALSHIREKLGESRYEQGRAFAVMIIVQKDDDPDGYHEIRSIHDYKQAMTFVTFPKPGKWKLGIALIEGETWSNGNPQDALQRALNQAFRNSKNGKVWDWNLSTLFEITHNPGKVQDLMWASNPTTLYPVGFAAVEVDVPETLFTTKTSGFLWDFANYFPVGTPADDCAVRRRVLAMATVGLIPYIAIEGAKRLALFLGGLLFFLFGYRHTSRLFGEVFAAKASAEHPDELPPTNDHGHVELWTTKRLFYLSPGFLGIYGIVGWAIWSSFDLIFSNIMVIAILVLAIGMVSAFVWLNESDSGRQIRYRWGHEAYKTKRAKEIRNVEVARAAELATLARRAQVLSCGSGPTQVSLEALPAEMRTVGLFFSNLKRKVCRPIA